MSDSQSKDPPLDCSEGCDERPHVHQWEIEPNPYGGNFDVLVTDDDDQALEAIMSAAEMIWDQCGDGMEMVIKIRRNKVTS